MEQNEKNNKPKKITNDETFKNPDGADESSSSGACGDSNSPKRNGKNELDPEKNAARESETRSSGDNSAVITPHNEDELPDEGKCKIFLRVIEHRGVLEKWKFIMRELDISENKIFEIEQDCKTYGIKETVYKALITWKEANPRFTLTNLSAALHKQGINDLNLYEIASHSQRCSPDDVASDVREKNPTSLDICFDMGPLICSRREEPEAQKQAGETDTSERGQRTEINADSRQLARVEREESRSESVTEETNPINFSRNEPAPSMPERAISCVDPEHVEFQLTTDQAKAFLEYEPWYVGNMNRDECDGLLKNIQHDRGFAVRLSDGGYRISVYYKNKVYHFEICLTSDEKYNIGKYDFSYIGHIVDYYQKNALFTASDGVDVSLGEPVAKLP